MKSDLENKLADAERKLKNMKNLELMLESLKKENYALKNELSDKIPKLNREIDELKRKLLQDQANNNNINSQVSAL